MRLAGSAAAMALLVSACTGSAPTSGEAPESGRVSAPNAYSGWSVPTYDGHRRSSFYVEVRDGTRLAVDLYRPTKNGVEANEKLPVVWMHSPYNRRSHGDGEAAETYPGYALRLAPHGYNVAVVDFRGVYASFGRNVGYNRGQWVDAARYDAYDVTEWFAKQPWSNGNVGMWGCSATGGSQMQALTTRPPSLKAVIPMSAEFDAYAFSTLGGVSSPRRIAPPNATGEAASIAMRDRLAAPVDGSESAARLAEAIASHRDNIESVGVVPFKDSISQETGLEWWKVSSPHTWLDVLRESDIGVLSVANWDEAGTRHGPFFTFNNLPKDNTKLLVGPATHCAWSAVKEETGFDLVTEELRFFDHWLKGKPNGVMEEPAVTYFTYNAPAGSAWRISETWPLKSEKRTDYHLSASGGLGTASATAGARAVEMGPPPVSQTVTIEPATVAAVFETEPLDADVEVTGHPVMSLWIRTTAQDADAMTQIFDVAPDGTTRSYQMIGRLRASHRKTAEAPYNHLALPWRTHAQADASPLPSGEPVELIYDLLPMSYIFKAGHRIRIAVSFSDPAHGASPPDVDILTGGEHASRITLPVIPTP